MKAKKKDVKTDFEVLVGRIQATSDALQQDALGDVGRVAAGCARGHQP